MVPILEVIGLKKSYQNFMLRDVSFTVPEECITGFIGVNGAGKSTMLEAAAIAAGTLTFAMDGLTNYGIRKGDAHYRCFDLGSNVDVQPQFPVEITAFGEVDGKEVIWSRSLNSAKRSIKPLLLGVPVSPTILFTEGRTFINDLNLLV